MDFVKIVRSVEEALYEAMSWLIFYPLTLWRVLRRPLRTMKYSDTEQRDKPEQQYLETLSPPLFLVLSLLLANGLDTLFGASDVATFASPLGRIIGASMQSLMVFNALVFSVHPLLYAAVLVTSAGWKLDRESLKAPFFAQCYLAGATAILVNVAGLGVSSDIDWLVWSGLGLWIATTLWYLNVQRMWFLRLDGMTQRRAVTVVLGVFLASAAVMLAALILLIGADPAAWTALAEG